MDSFVILVLLLLNTVMNVVAIWQRYITYTTWRKKDG